MYEETVVSSTLYSLAKKNAAVVFEWSGNYLNIIVPPSKNRTDKGLKIKLNTIY